MLTFSFFTAVFLTISWLMYIGTYIFSRLGGVSPAALGLTDLAVYTALAVVPLFVIWMTWNGFYRFRHEKNLQKQFKNIEAQFKQNQEFFEIVARMLWQGQQNRQNHFVLERTELFVSELNGLLADMLQRYNFISDSEAAKLWSTAEKGNKWGFAKALISLQNGSVDFENRLYRAAVRENLLRGTVNEFCARYARLLELLKMHDQEKIFLPVIETGALGKAFAILAPLADRLQQNQPAAPKTADEPELFADAEMRIAPAAERADDEIADNEEDPLAELEELSLTEIFGEEINDGEERQPAAEPDHAAAAGKMKQTAKARQAKKKNRTGKTSLPRRKPTRKPLRNRCLFRQKKQQRKRPRPAKTPQPPKSKTKSAACLPAPASAEKTKMKTTAKRPTKPRSSPNSATCSNASRQKSSRGSRKPRSTR